MSGRPVNKSYDTYIIYIYIYIERERERERERKPAGHCIDKRCILHTLS